MLNHRKALKKAKSPQARKKLGPPSVGTGPASSSSPAWSGSSIPTVQTGKAALDKLLKEDRIKREKELDKIKWFHANTPRNLAEIKLKDGKHKTFSDIILLLMHMPSFYNYLSSFIRCTKGHTL